MSNTEKLPTAPDWSKAPEKATHHAIDSDGKGYWYSEAPESDEIGWDIVISKWMGPSGIFDATNWNNSLQKRPETK